MKYGFYIRLRKTRGRKRKEEGGKYYGFYAKELGDE
jgi:hypothetical protein